MGALLRSIDAFAGMPSTVWAHRLAPQVFLRPGELRQLGGDRSGGWCIPPSRMKMKREHVVPLSKRAVAILKEAQGVTGRSFHIAFLQTRRDRKPCLARLTEIG